MTIYLAARYGRKNELAERARELQALGVTITSRWHNNPSEPYPRTNYERHPAMTNIAEQDLLDIHRAEALLVFTEEGRILGGGHHWETGYAYAQKKTIYLLGPRYTVFYHLADVRQYHSWEELKHHLAQM
jgi:nucleoside 2-deoxyribosyltransferase